MVIAPGLVPGRNTKFPGMGYSGAGTCTCVPQARENPTVATFTTEEEKICVSCKLAR